MKVQILSDLHIEFEDFKTDFLNSDVVVLAGDIHLGTKGVEWALESIKDKPVLYILGNHEYYKQTYPKLTRKIREVIEGTNVILLENETIVVNGVTFHGATLWTDFELFGDPRIAGYECQQQMTDFEKIRKEPGYSKIRALDVSVIHKRSLRWLAKSITSSSTEQNIVVTHHGPSLLSVPEQYKQDIITAAYVSNLETFVEGYKPNLWVHGHLHNSSDYNISGCRVVCNPLGYPGERNRDFNSQFIVNV